MIAIVDKADGKIMELHDSYIGVSSLAVFPNKKTAVKWLKEYTFAQLSDPVSVLMKQKRWQDYWRETESGVEYIKLKKG